MKNQDKHELYCGCAGCKPTRQAPMVPSPAEAREAGLQGLEAEKQGPTKEILDPQHAEGG